MELRVENWNGHPIRFVGEGDHWDAIGFDVTDALGYQNGRDAIERHVDKTARTIVNLNTVVKHDSIKRGNPNVVVISEYGIYSLVFSSKLETAKRFRHWVYGVLIRLRHTAGLQGYQAFRMLDKRIQQQAMARLEPVSDKDYIKANVIADKAVSNLYGLPKMIKKRDMTQPMLEKRPEILNNVVDLMNIKKRFGLDFSVSDTIYSNLDNEDDCTVANR